MARPIFHKFQIEAVHQGADGDAEEHSKNAERLAADRDRHQHEDSRKADGFSDDPGIDQIPFELLQVGHAIRRGRRAVGDAVDDRRAAARAR